MEHWDESDSEIDADNLTQCDEHVQVDKPLDQELDSFVWWVVAFTCIFQTLHSLSARAIQWLLLFLSVTFTFLGKFSERISRIATSFPSTIYRRTQFLKQYISTPSVKHFVVCPACHALHKFEQCFEKRGTQTLVKRCNVCLSAKENVVLLYIEQWYQKVLSQKSVPLQFCDILIGNFD